MWFVIIGVLLFVMKMADLGPVANWSWLVVLAPFACAVLWWSFSDKIGLTQRREMQRMEDRKTERRNRALEALGISSRRDRHVRRARDAARRVAAENPPPAPPPPTKLTPDLPPGEEPRKEPRL